MAVSIRNGLVHRLLLLLSQLIGGYDIQRFEDAPVFLKLIEFYS